MTHLYLDVAGVVVVVLVLDLDDRSPFQADFILWIDCKGSVTVSAVEVGILATGLVQREEALVGVSEILIGVKAWHVNLIEGFVTSQGSTSASLGT